MQNKNVETTLNTLLGKYYTRVPNIRIMHVRMCVWVYDDKLQVFTLEYIITQK